MRRLLTVAAALALTAGPASAQDDRPLPIEPPSGLIVGVSGGTATNGPVGRMVLGRMWPLGPASVGLVARVVLADGPYPITPGGRAIDDVYAEWGLSARGAWRPVSQAEVAASVGYGIAILGDDTRTFFPIHDYGFTAPVEVEGAVRLWGPVAATASASRSLPLGSMLTEDDGFEVAEGYALDHWTATVGLRVGGW